MEDAISVAKIDRPPMGMYSLIATIVAFETEILVGIFAASEGPAPGSRNIGVLSYFTVRSASGFTLSQVINTYLNRCFGHMAPAQDQQTSLSYIRFALASWLPLLAGMEALQATGATGNIIRGASFTAQNAARKWRRSNAKDGCRHAHSASNRCTVKPCHNS